MRREVARRSHCFGRVSRLEASGVVSLRANFGGIREGKQQKGKEFLCSFSVLLPLF
jgi:hypothetical protein